MGKTRDLFKKVRDKKGTFHAKMGTIKEKKKYGPNRSKRYWEVTRIHVKTVKKKKKILSDSNNYNVVITPIVRYPRVWSQVYFRKHQYEQS